jgi:hypothetical protein
MKDRTVRGVLAVSPVRLASAWKFVKGEAEPAESLGPRYE